MDSDNEKAHYKVAYLLKTSVASSALYLYDFHVFVNVGFSSKLQGIFSFFFALCYFYICLWIFYLFHHIFQGLATIKTNDIWRPVKESLPLQRATVCC